MSLNNKPNGIIEFKFEKTELLDLQRIKNNFRKSNNSVSKTENYDRTFRDKFLIKDIKDNNTLVRSHVNHNNRYK